LASLANSANTRVYFQYGYGVGYGYETPKVIKTTTGNYFANITGLTNSATVHFRAVSDFNGVLSYGADAVFNTLAAPATSAAPTPTSTAAVPVQDSASNPMSIVYLIGIGLCVILWFLFGKERLIQVALAVVAFFCLWAFWGVFTSTGTEVAATPGAPSYFGLVWALQNIGWLVLIGIIAVVMYILMGGREALNRLVRGIRK
jgi:hypothetical protein